MGKVPLQRGLPGPSLECLPGLSLLLSLLLLLVHLLLVLQPLLHYLLKRPVNTGEQVLTQRKVINLSSTEVPRL